MSAFIPMVSTTPPPIDDDDDDFGDFMDGGGDENDDFADFSSPKDFDDFSYPSHNPSSDKMNSLDQESDNEEPSISMHELNKESEDESTDQEVKNVMANHQDNSIKSGIVENENAIQVSCNGSTVDDDWFQSDNDDPPTALSQDDGTNESDPNKQINLSEDSVSSNDEDRPGSETNIENSGGPRVHTSEQTFDLKNENFPDNNDVIENTRDDFAPPESTVTQVEKTPGAEQQEDSLGDDQGDIENSGSISTSPEFMPDSDCKSDSDLHDDGKTGVPGERTITQPSLDSIEVENTSLSQPEFVPDTSGPEETEKQIPPEIVEIEAGENFQDFNVDPQDSQDSSQTSMNSCHVIDNPLPKSQSNQDIPANSDQDLPFQADFGNADDEDDFADFGSFDTQPFNEPGNVQSHEPTDMEFNAFESNTALADHDDSFADFSNAGNSEAARDNDDFGGFATTDADNDDDFGDFDSNSTNWAGFSDTVKKKPTLHEKVGSFVSRYMREITEDIDAQIPHLDDHLISDTLSKDVESPSKGSVESAGIVWPGDLWDQLEDIDNTIALSFVWNGSYHNKYLLDALGMRTQNILFSGTKQAYYVPTYYAAALGEVSPEESHPEWKTIADEQTSGQGMTVASSWLHSEQSVCNQDDSEITSKPVPILSSALDLDYFDNLPTATENLKLPGGTDLIDPELLEVTSAPSTEPPPPPKDPSNVTLSKILASIKGDSNSSTLITTQYSQHQDDSKWADEENKLSAEARSVLQKLPDLSYMRSKVLIFPMNMSRLAIGEE